jgi:hypothetical protein
MDSWYRSDVTHARLESLVKRGLLCVRTEAMEWLVPDREEAPTPPDGYVVSFHERGLMILPHRFSRDCCTTTRSSCSI